MNLQRRTKVERIKHHRRNITKLESHIAATRKEIEADTKYLERLERELSAHTGVAIYRYR